MRLSSLKFWGKLRGLTGALLTGTSAPNATTPYRAATVGSKAIARHEDATTEVLNRLPAAVQENLESIAGILSAPALLDAEIVGTEDSNEDHGLPSLSDKNYNFTSVIMATRTTSGTGPGVPTWVYVGLHKAQLSKYLRLYKYPGRTAEAYDAEAPTSPASFDVVSPVDVTAQSGGSSFFGTQSYGGEPGAPQRILLSIPPIAPTAPSLPPYNGSSLAVAITSWQVDGCTISLHTWEELYARPGCFALVASSTSNDGLYYIAALPTPGKAVLTRGGLHKATVASGTPFAAGDIVGWNPEDAAATANAGDCTRFAYVAYKSGTTLYLATIGGEEDFATQSVLAPPQKGGLPVTSLLSVGDVGLADQEIANGVATGNAIPPGTRLHTVASGYSTITALIPANYPVAFSTTGTAGNATLCNPLGFLLSPTLSFSTSEGAPGNYKLRYKTLSTVSEKITAMSRAQFSGQHDTLGTTDEDAAMIRAFARNIRTGAESAADRDTGSITAPHPAHAFAGPANILGENVWLLQAETKSPTLFASLSTAYPLEVDDSFRGRQVTLTHASFGDLKATVELCAANGTSLIVRDVYPHNWTDEDHLLADGRIPLYDQPFVLTANAVTYQVSALYAPALRDAAGNGYVPIGGLQSLYDNDFSATALRRGVPNANRVLLRDDTGLTFILPTGHATGSAAAVMRVVSDGAPTTVSLVHWEAPAGPSTAGVCVVDSEHLAFYDTYASNIKLSDVTDFTLPVGDLSILGALWRISVESAGTVTDLGTLTGLATPLFAVLTVVSGVDLAISPEDADACTYRIAPTPGAGPFIVVLPGAEETFDGQRITLILPLGSTYPVTVEVPPGESINDSAGGTYLLERNMQVVTFVADVGMTVSWRVVTEVNKPRYAFEVLTWSLDFTDPTGMGGSNTAYMETAHTGNISGAGLPLARREHLVGRTGVIYSARLVVVSRSFTSTDTWRARLDLDSAQVGVTADYDNTIATGNYALPLSPALPAVTQYQRLAVALEVDGPTGWTAGDSLRAYVRVLVKYEL